MTIAIMNMNSEGIMKLFLRLRTISENLVTLVSSYCESHNIEYKAIKNPHLIIYEIFIVDFVDERH